MSTKRSQKLDESKRTTSPKTTKKSTSPDTTKRSTSPETHSTHRRRNSNDDLIEYWNPHLPCSYPNCNGNSVKDWNMCEEHFESDESKFITQSKYEALMQRVPVETWNPPFPCCYKLTNGKPCGKDAVKGWDMCSIHYAKKSSPTNEKAKNMHEEDYKRELENIVLEENLNLKKQIDVMENMFTEMNSLVDKMRTQFLNISKISGGNIPSLQQSDDEESDEEDKYERFTKYSKVRHTPYAHTSTYAGRRPDINSPDESDEEKPIIKNAKDKTITKNAKVGKSIYDEDEEYDHDMTRELADESEQEY